MFDRRYDYDRRSSHVVDLIVSNGNASRQEISDYLGIRKSSFSNKMCRNSFSVEDLLDIAYICGYTDITFKKDNCVVGIGLKSMHLQKEFANHVKEVELED